jgi:hypothetical protein
MTIQVKIAELLVAQSLVTDNPLKKMIEGKSTQEICQLIFKNYRGDPSKAKGLKLSEVGLQLMKSFFKGYDVPMPEGYKVKLPHLLYLDRISTLPYFINNKCFTTFDSDLAMMLKLSDSKIETLIEAKYRLQFDKSSFLPDV